MSVDAGGDPIRRKIGGVMITYDGGSKIFTDVTPDEERFFYDNYSTFTTAREMVGSFVTSEFPDDMNPHAREVNTRAYSGSRSLEVVYNIADIDDPSATPITKPIASVTEGTYYARARVMSNRATTFDIGVEEVEDNTSRTFSANPGHWTDVSFSFEAEQGSNPYLTITAPPGARDLEFYVDAVGIMTEDEPYFDGDTKGPYVWTGAPHASSSATIPVVGVPEAKMEIMYRNAWIG